MEISVSMYVAIFLGIVAIVLVRYIVKSCERMQSTIDRQNDTIQRLINREPVTYAETGQKPQGKPKERYSAWAGQMVNLDEDEGRS